MKGNTKATVEGESVSRFDGEIASVSKLLYLRTVNEICDVLGVFVV